MVNELFSHHPDTDQGRYDTAGDHGENPGWPKGTLKRKNGIAGRQKGRE